MSDPRTAPAIEWLAVTVPGFRYAYVHSAEFHAAIEAQLSLWLMQAELMSIGAMEKDRRTRTEIDRLERRLPNPYIVVADSQQGMQRGV